MLQSGLSIVGVVMSSYYRSPGGTAPGGVFQGRPPHLWIEEIDLSARCCPCEIDSRL